MPGELCNIFFAAIGRDFFESETNDGDDALPSEVVLARTSVWSEERFVWGMTLIDF